MAAAAHRILGPQIRGGLIVTSWGQTKVRPWSDPETIVGGHPTPTADSERAGRRALEIARSLQADEMLLVLLSGGASALMAAPAAGVSLEDKRETTARLLRGGADIQALNTVRKHLSAIKGGQLAAAGAGPTVTYAVSDVVGDDLSVIGSGPTVGDASTFNQALETIGRFGGAESYPRAVIARLTAGARGEHPETPKPGDRRLSTATASVIGGRRDAMTGAQEAALRCGYQVVRLEDALVGEARTAAVAHLTGVLKQAAGFPRPTCVIRSGETTVRVTGSGKGGRNQEFALAAAELLAPLAARRAGAVVASVGTDGVDGPTDAAGAIADTTTIRRMREAGLGDPEHYFKDNNTYELFSQLGDLIHTGPTGTNVGDLQVVLFA
jgi:hydroxypyruvate reductase